jgi:hypothetical protein
MYRFFEVYGGGIFPLVKKVFEGRVYLNPPDKQIFEYSTQKKGLVQR